MWILLGREYKKPAGLQGRERYQSMHSVELDSRSNTKCKRFRLLSFDSFMNFVVGAESN